MLNEITGAVLQIVAFTLIPFLVYLVQKKTAQGFLDYIGLKKSTKRANYLALFACLLFLLPMLILTFTHDEFNEIMFEPNSVTGKFRQMGFSAESVLILLIIAVFKTSLAEEILFRGFIAKRLIRITGYQKGNILQALIFGLLHTALFSMITNNYLFLFVIFAIPSLGAYVSTFLNEKIANGSIIPGWISHGLANVLAYSIFGFIL
jgi:membrane protease YdiL (CAAX protease family)